MTKTPPAPEYLPPGSLRYRISGNTIGSTSLEAQTYESVSESNRRVTTPMSAMPATICPMPTAELAELGGAPVHAIIDLFAGPGGLDVAAHWLGLTPTGVEIDANAHATRKNAGLESRHCDVRTLRPDQFPNATILTAGPPCQTYTVAGTGTGRRSLDLITELVEKLANDNDIDKSLASLEDERTGLVLEPLKWALRAFETGTPYTAVVLEQVPAVLPVWEAYAEVLEDRGYGVDCGILKTEQYGVPQTRRRAVLIARLGSEAMLPRPTHQAFRKGTNRPSTSRLKPWVAMGEALDCKEFFTVVSNYGSGGNPKNRGRRNSDEPSSTVTGKVTRNRVLTSDGERRLTLPEAGVLQTFPPDYPWSGSDISQQIGNAIPPRLAAHVLASALGGQLDPSRLDKAVSSSWSTTRHGVPDLLVTD